MIFVAVPMGSMDASSVSAHSLSISLLANTHADVRLQASPVLSESSVDLASRLTALFRHSLTIFIVFIALTPPVLVGSPSHCRSYTMLRDVVGSCTLVGQ